MIQSLFRAQRTLLPIDGARAASLRPASAAAVRLQAKCCPSPFEGCCSFFKGGKRVTECKERSNCFRQQGGRLVGDSRCC